MTYYKFKSASIAAFCALSIAATMGFVPNLAMADDLDDAPEIDSAQPHEPSQNAPLKTDGTLDEAPEYTASSSHIGGSSGFYFKGSLGGSLAINSVLSQTGSASIKQRIGNAFQISGGVGYGITDVVRLEGEVGYLGNMKFKNIAGQSKTFDGTVFSVNAFADLGTVVGITPYIGVGMGAAKLKGTEPRLRLNAQTGFAYKLNEKLALEIGYEYSEILGGDLDINGMKYNQEDFDMHMFKIGTRIKF